MSRALELAEMIEGVRAPYCGAAAAELRRLAAVKAERDALKAELERIRALEPVAAQHRFRHPQKTEYDWSAWQLCDVRNRPPYKIDSQGYEVEYRNLYTLEKP